MEKADRDALDVERLERRHQGQDRGLVERRQHAAVRGHALGHGEAQLARNERRGLDQIEVVLIEAALVGDREHVAKTCGRDQGGERALALDHGVGGKRRAVDHEADVAGAQPGRLEHLVDRLQDGPLRGDGRRQHLGGGPAIAGLDDDVGERAANVDREARRCPLLMHQPDAPTMVTRPGATGRADLSRLATSAGKPVSLAQRRRATAAVLSAARPGLRLGADEPPVGTPPGLPRRGRGRLSRRRGGCVAAFRSDPPGRAQARPGSAPRRGRRRRRPGR